MDIKKILLEKNFIKEIKELSFEETLQIPSNEEIRYLNNISLYRVFKLFIKRYLVNFINFFLNKKINYDKERSVENVKAKYEQIAGSYIEYFYNEEKKIDNFTAYNHFEKKIYSIKGERSIDPPINVISKFCNHHNIKSLIEIGAGELTTLYPIIKKTDNINFISALDLSPNRLRSGNEFLNKNGHSINHLIACDASNIPYKDNSFDLVFTQYCIEQVPLLAKKIIDEMIRISSKYIIIIEPTYEFSNRITRNRILLKGFPILKKSHFKNKSSKIIYRDGLPFTRFELYAELTILEKNNKFDGKPVLCHPLNKQKIELNNEFITYGKDKIKIKEGIIDLFDLLKNNKP